MELRKIVKEELKVYLLKEYGAPDYTDEQIRQELSPLNDEAVEQIIKAKNNYFTKKPSSFYDMDVKYSSGKEAQLIGKDILEYVIMMLNQVAKKKGSAYMEAVAFLETMI